MKLKTVKKLEVPKESYEEPVKKERKKSQNRLPADGYTPLLPPKRFLVRETRSYKDNSPMKQYIEISVKRIDDDKKDEAMPFVYIQMYQESNFYTGYLKGKSVYLPIEMLYDLIDTLSAVSDECEEKGF